MAKQNQHRLQPGTEIVGNPGEQIEGIVVPPTVFGSETTGGQIAVQISVPIATTPAGYITRRVDVRGMTAKQSQRLHDITYGLRAAEMKLHDGTIITSPMHAIKWMLEQ